MKKNIFGIKHVTIAIGIIAICLLSSSCKMGHSSLVDKDDIPDCCKIALECFYYQQKGDKSVCGEYKTCCVNSLVWNKCKKEFPDDTEKFQKCWDKLK